MAALSLPPQDFLRYDELRSPDGVMRPTWQRFFAALPGDDPAAELERRRHLVAPQLRAQEVTHNVYGSEGPSTRPWPLELLPQILSDTEWATIEAGVAQRARLLDAMMADLYGPQRLLHEALLPPALLYRHPGYLRPLHGVRPVGDLFIHIAAFDLACGPDGRWWIVSQRTQGPSGLGYVLHNRQVVSRLFPEAIRDLRVAHVADGLQRMLDTVETLAAPLAGGGAPRIALFTPGPANETYFEQAWLARHLGLPLVEGGDLTVRGDTLYVKTVEGLEPVHGLLRRVDDGYCDPLELRSDSTLGVPGLLQVVRAGRVVVANALGSAFLESPAVQGFLPGIAETLLHEPLVLPSLPTWWCGEPAAWATVRDDIPGLVQRAAFDTGLSGTARLIEPDQADAVRSRIDDDPDAWVVQGLLPFAQAPLWRHGGLTMRPATLRVYAVADTSHRWHVLPGGMSRIGEASSFAMSMQQGGASLDTWVVGDDDAAEAARVGPPPLSVDDIARRRSPVPSRTAEYLFWLGRTSERAGQSVRLVSALLALMHSELGAPAVVLDAMTRLLKSSGVAPLDAPSGAQALWPLTRSVLATLTDPGALSIGHHLQALMRGAGALRERLDPEQVALVRRMGEDFAAELGAAGGVPLSMQVQPALDRLALRLAALTGMQTDRMARDPGWRLMTIGRLIERLIGVARVFTHLAHEDVLASAAGVDLLLDLVDSTIAYRARYQRHSDLLALVDLLVLDDTQPRAFAGILRRLRFELEQLPGLAVDDWADLLPAEPDGAGLRLQDLRDVSPAALCAQVRLLAERLGDGAAALSERLGLRYFAHAEPSQHVVRS